MIKVFLFSLIFLQVFGAPDGSFENLAEFKKFVKDFNRNYQDEKEFQKRFEIFSENLNLIRKYNQEDFAKGISYSINDFADLTEDEYRQSYLMNPIKKSLKSNENSNKNTVENNAGVIPESIDWRNVNNQNHVSSVKYQGICGSCWAFAVAQSIESAVSINSGTGNPESLSSQQILDCTPNSGKCQGGEPLDAIQYVIDHGGLTTAKSYPYLFFSTKCRDDNKSIVANISTYLLGSTEGHIAQLVGLKGPVVVCANFATNKNRFYHGGIADDPECGTEPTHALIVVGYTPDYWILKNTYSTIWGEKGYMRVKRDVNWCGLTTENSILPIV